MSKDENKKRVPNLRFKGFTDDWMQEKLSDFYSFSNGINTSKENYGKGRKMISVMDILSDEYIYFENILSSVQVSKKIENSNKVKKNDLLFVRSSETVEEVGWSKVYRDTNYSLFSGFVIRGTNEKKVNSFFVENSLNYKNRDQIEKRANGSTRFNISQKTLNTITLLLPKIEEQSKIAKAVEILDKIITLEQEKNDSYLQTRNLMLQYLFPAKEIFNPDFQFGKSIEWKSVELGTQVNITTGKLNANAMVNNGKYPFFTCAKETYLTDTYSFNDEALLIAGNGEIGLVKYYYGKFDAYQRTYVLTNIKPDAKFLQYYLERFLPERIYTMTYGSTMPYITLSTLLDMKIKLPPMNEQIKIGEILTKVDSTISTNKQRIKSLEKSKKIILKNMYI